jgi:hypothetical protein
MDTQLPGGRSATRRRAPVVLSEQTLRRIYNEFIEMPGLRLTLPQAQRLWGLDEETCASSLSFLVDAKFLTRVDNRLYTRLTDGAVHHPPFRMAKVDRLIGNRRVADHVKHSAR